MVASASGIREDRRLYSSSSSAERVSVLNIMADYALIRASSSAIRLTRSCRSPSTLARYLPRDAPVCKDDALIARSEPVSVDSFLLLSLAPALAASASTPVLPSPKLVRNEGG